METIMNEAILTSALIALVLTPMMQAVKRLKKVDANYLPFISWALGMVLGAVAALAFGFDLSLYILAGLIAGMGSNGIYDGFKSLKEVK